MGESQVLWLDLPHELWPLIGQRLETYIDVLRFRSVCRLWRNSLPELKVVFPTSRPYSKFFNIMCEFGLFQRIIYRFNPLDRHQSSNSISSSSSRAEGFLAMIYHTNLDTRFMWPLIYSSERKEVNILDFRIQEVPQSYSICCRAMQKITLFPDSACINVDLDEDKNIRVAVALDRYGFLVSIEYEENRSKTFRFISEGCNYDDIIVFKGQIYTVDRHGRVFLIDSSTKLVQISASLNVCGDLKHLVECGGELYVVDRVVERKASELDQFNVRRWCKGKLMSKSVDFKVYRLDLERGRLVEVKNLGNHAFVLELNCFSIYAPVDLEGFEKNCIYFFNEVNSCFSDGYNDAHVFDLEKNTILKSPVRILKAPHV